MPDGAAALRGKKLIFEPTDGCKITLDLSDEQVQTIKQMNEDDRNALLRQIAMVLAPHETFVSGMIAYPKLAAELATIYADGIQLLVQMMEKAGPNGLIAVSLDLGGLDHGMAWNSRSSTGVVLN